MNAKLISLLAVPVLAGAVLGGKAVSSHFRTIRDEVKSSVRGAAPAGYEQNRIRNLIADTSKDVLTFRDKISEIDAAAAAQRDDVKRLEQRVAADRKDLLAEREMLARGDEIYIIRGNPYSRTQVEASANARMAQIQRDQATMETKKQAVERLEVAVREGQVRLRETMGARDAKIQELDMLSAELANAELQRDLQELSAPLRDPSLARSKSELAESMKAFADRVREAKNEVEAMPEASAPALITHESSGSPGVIERIDQLLAPTPVSSASDQ